MDEQQDQHVIGDTTKVSFGAFHSKPIEGKVDSGATTSCLHATDIHVNGGSVTFKCQALSANVITMSLAGTQDVSSADGGENERPVIRTDVEIDGKLIKNVEFNLNDRSEMDSPVLIGQNILKAGGFVIDVTHNDKQPNNNLPAVSEQQIMEALDILRQADITLDQLFTYMQTDVVNRLK